MRCCLVLGVLGVTGCELVFPLTHTATDASVDASLPLDAREFDDAPTVPIPSQPVITAFTVEPQPFAQEAASGATITVTGIATQTMYARFDAMGIAGFTPASTSAVLAAGPTVIAVGFTPPPRFGNVLASAIVSYDPDFGEFNGVPLAIPVRQHFGHTITAATAQLTPNQILAMQIDVGFPAGKLVEVSFTAASSGKIQLALYNNIANAPRGLVGALPPIQLDALATRTVAIPVPFDVSGKLWLAMLVESKTDVGATGAETTTDATPAVTTVATKFIDGLPDPFGPSTVEAKRRDWSMAITVAP